MFCVNIPSLTSGFFKPLNILSPRFGVCEPDAGGGGVEPNRPVCGPLDCGAKMLLVAVFDV